MSAPDGIRLAHKAVAPRTVGIVYEKAVHEDRCVLVADTPLRIRITKPPTSRLLEGCNVNPAALTVGQVYELDNGLAERLLAWGYAEPVLTDESEHDSDNPPPQ